nr:MAG TPA: hypothetical protein [Bacteriophage sp.]
MGTKFFLYSDTIISRQFPLPYTPHSATYSTINIATNRQMAVKACSLVGHRLGA